MSDFKWWQTAVFYQIYPRSFADGDGDGIGDLKGMLARLDYVQDLGVDAVWLSPHYPSPQVDCGYDIADYTDVAPEYGTLALFKQFLEAAHERNIRVILDLVLNHTSDQHLWFIESRSSRDNPKRDWYVWRDGKKGGPPNNWYSTFTGSAWEYDERTEQYYYHFFLKEQPDLNWRNPEVQEAMWEVVRFWLDMGVDGFRLDAIGTIFEDPALLDHEGEMTLVELYQAFEAARTQEEYEALEAQMNAVFKYQVEQPGMHELMQALRALVDEYPDRVLVGENHKIAYYGDGDNELHLVFNFPLMRTERLTPAWVLENQEERLGALPPGAWPCNTLGNHDSMRVYSRFADGEHDDALARLSLALMLTLRGTPFLYNGEEIGMTNLVLTDIGQFRDTLALLYYRLAVEEVGMPPEQAVALIGRMSRDGCRTPMQWDNAPNAGFSPAGVETWLPVNPNYADGVNVAEQLEDPVSLLNFYRRMLAVRRRTPALIVGDYAPLPQTSEDYLAFTRTTDEQTCLVILNMSDQTHTLDFDPAWQELDVIFSSHKRSVGGSAASVEIQPFEVYIADVSL